MTNGGGFFWLNGKPVIHGFPSGTFDCLRPEPGRAREPELCRKGGKARGEVP